MSAAPNLFGHEVIEGDVLDVPLYGPLRVVAIEHDSYGTRLHLEDNAVLISRYGGRVSVSTFGDRESRPVRYGYPRRLSRVHFPNGTTADSNAPDVVLALFDAALDQAQLPPPPPGDRRYSHRDTISVRYWHPELLCEQLHYLDPVNPAVTLCGRTTFTKHLWPGEITNCWGCEYEAKIRRVGP